MTTSADRFLLRWVPFAAILAVVMAVSLTVGSQPFGFHGWPKAPAPRSIDKVVRVAPANSRVAIASSEPATPPKPAHEAVAAERGAGSAAPTRRPADHAGRTPRHRSSGADGRDRSRAPVDSPTPRTGDGHPAGKTPDGTPVAQGPRPLPRGAAAKPQVRHAGPPHTTVDVRLRFTGRHGEGHGHGRGHGVHGLHLGRGRHGRH